MGGRRLVIIGYHNVTPTAISAFPYDVGVRGLQAQLATLRDHASVLPLSRALIALANGDPLPARSVALTFDDGYTDALDVAVPLLQRYALPATFFLVPGFIERTCDAWWERLGWAVMSASRNEVLWRGRRMRLSRRWQRFVALEWLLGQLKRMDRATRDHSVEELVDRLSPIGRPPTPAMFLDWKGCREVAAHGIEIGSHSATHMILGNEDPDDQFQDLASSRKILESQLEVPIELLAYPNGRRTDYSRDTVRAAQRAGYTYAVTTEHGWNDVSTSPFELSRIIVSPRYGNAGLLKAIAQLALAPIRRRTDSDVSPVSSKGETHAS
jgi:peptidoglycan/xylan/chitin deacetylase (PgdA/CDA1 family)